MIKDKAYLELVADILSHSEYKKLRKLRHHHRSVYIHCLMVSYHSYKIAKFLGADYKAAARAGLLHDFFLYDWREKKPEKQKFFELHGFSHPHVALKNSNEHFVLSKIEEDMIKKHMFPLTVRPPRYLETWIIVTVDKYIAIGEYFSRFKWIFKKTRIQRLKRKRMKVQ